MGCSHRKKAIYYGCATLSGSFSGLIAYGIQKNLTLEATGKESWRWLFIIEGTLAMFVGALALLLLPNFPEQQRGKKHWLYRQDEIEVAINRLRCKLRVPERLENTPRGNKHDG